MTDYTTSEKSPSELERDAERVRAQIADTAEHLKDKMSPGQLMDEVVNYFKEGDANEFLSNLKTQVRDNPMALALVGSGLAWLMMGSGSSGARHRTARRSSEPAATYRAASPTSQHAGGEQSSGIGSMASKGSEAIRKAGASAGSSIGEAASSATDTLRATAHDVRDAAGDYLSQASHATSDAAAQVKNSFLDALEREPLVLGALGVAVGAAIGAMLPATRTEQEYLGPTGEKMRHAAEAALSEGVDKASHIASDVYAAAKDEADRQGLTRSGTPMTEKLAEVTKAAGSELKSATHDAVRQATETADRATDNLSPDKNRSS